MQLSAGTHLGPYQIVSQLGSGGMGVVYQAHDPRLDRHVAIKLLPPELTKDDTAKQRFLQEAKAASALDHPNICTIHEINETADGQLYLVMAHYEGETLKERISRGPLELNDAIDLAMQVGQGLAKAHAAGIVHRDIKPANLMVTADGTVKILDFGLAKLAGSEGVTQTGTTVGTVAYMSPEQARGEPVDHRTDIWSLGVVVYEMLAGKPPFRGENLLSISNAILDQEPPALTGLSSAAQGLTARGLQKDQGRRFQRADDLVAELRQLRSSLTAPTMVTVSQPEMPSIAVLPFTNMSNDPDQEYFCDGLAEELIDALARLRGLHVVARTSAFQFRGKGHDLREVGEKLKVKTVLEGSVRKAGNRLRINAQLINASDGYHLWSERYDRTMDDVFKVQDEIAGSVVAQLRIKLIRNTEAPLITHQVDDLEAYHLFLQGRLHLGRMTDESIGRGLTCLNQALKKDPGYARAQAEIAWGHALRGLLSMDAPRSAMGKSQAALREALSIDDTLDEAHFVSAFERFWFGWDWTVAEQEFQKTLELNPNHSLAYGLYGYMLACVSDRTKKGVALARRGLDLDPLAPMCTHSLAGTLLAAGLYEDAAVEARKTLELDPNYVGAFWFLGLASAALGKHRTALDVLRQGVTRAPDDVISQAFLARELVLEGMTDEAERILERLEKRRHQVYTSACCIAVVCTALGKVDEAFRYLSVAQEERDGMLVRLPGWFPSLRADPRFQALLRKMKLPQVHGS